MPRYVGLDPSTKTGFVVLDEDGEIWEARELEGKGENPGRMHDLICQVGLLIQPGDRVAVEGFGFASQRGFELGGIGWGIRLNLFARKIGYTEIAPSQLKKFTGSGGNAGKEEVAVETYKRWGFQHKSNNVTDAYVLAQIVRAMHEPVKLIKVQQEVIQKLRG